MFPSFQLRQHVGDGGGGGGGNRAETAATRFNGYHANNRHHIDGTHPLRRYTFWRLVLEHHTEQNHLYRPSFRGTNLHIPSWDESAVGSAQSGESGYEECGDECTELVARHVFTLRRLHH